MQSPRFGDSSANIADDVHVLLAVAGIVAFQMVLLVGAFKAIDFLVQP